MNPCRRTKQAFANFEKPTPKTKLWFAKIQKKWPHPRLSTK